jgi:hypothetical protein
MRRGARRHIHWKSSRAAHACRRAHRLHLRCVYAEMSKTTLCSGQARLSCKGQHSDAPRPELTASPYGHLPLGRARPSKSYWLCMLLYAIKVTQYHSDYTFVLCGRHGDFIVCGWNLTWFVFFLLKDKVSVYLLIREECILANTIDSMGGKVTFVQYRIYNTPSVSKYKMF